MKRTRAEAEEERQEVANKKLKLAEPTFWICSSDTNKVTAIQTSDQGFLPARENGDKPTLVLDMDETLIHAQRKELQIKLGGRCVGKKKRKLWCVYKRPFVDEFLKQMEKLYEVVIFTAASQEYADSILDKLDTEGVISHRLYRQHCSKKEGHHHKVKDLARTGRDLAKVVIIDNHKHSFALNVDNGLKIKSFNGEAEDQELRKMVPLLTDLAHATDVRQVIHDRLTNLTKVH